MIARWLAERTIHPVLLDRVHEGAGEGRRFESVADLLRRLDPPLARRLGEEILPQLAILDPACGSGALLEAALRTLAPIYEAVFAPGGPTLPPEEIRRRILRDNLYGVDLSAAAIEAAQERLLQALPGGGSELHLFRGNPLLGLLHVDDAEFERRGEGLFRPTFRDVLDEKRQKGDDRAAGEVRRTLDEILLTEFAGMPGKPGKRPVAVEELAAWQPFHWAYELDAVLEERGGFDVSLLAPSWEDWLAYLERFPPLGQYLRTSPQYSHPIAAVLEPYAFFLARSFRLLRSGGRCGAVLPASLYADPAGKSLRETLFTHTRVEALLGLSNERALFPEEDPDLRLCLLLFARGGETESFPAAFRTGRKNALSPDRLAAFLEDETAPLPWSWSLVQRLSPGSLVIPEDKGPVDLALLKKAYRFPALGSEVPGSWTASLGREFEATGDGYLFRTAPGPHRLPLCEARRLDPFTAEAGAPRYWLEEDEARRALLGRKADTGQPLGYQEYRLALREGARGAGERALVPALLPPGRFCGDKLWTVVPRSPEGRLDLPAALSLAAILGSVVVDSLLRQRAAGSVTLPALSQLPVPRPEGRALTALVELAARLTCTTPDLAGLWQGAVGTFWFAEEAAVDPADRERLGAEIDARVARLYGLSEEELTHVLATAPGIDPAGREAVLAAYRGLGG